MHVSCKWIAARVRDVPLHVDAARLDKLRLAMHEYAVARFHQQIVERVAIERVPQINAEYLGRSVRLNAKNLRRIQPRIRRNASRLIQNIPQALLPGSSVAAG